MVRKGDLATGRHNSEWSGGGTFLKILPVQFKNVHHPFAPNNLLHPRTSVRTWLCISLAVKSGDDRTTPAIRCRTMARDQANGEPDGSLEQESQQVGFRVPLLFPVRDGTTGLLPHLHRVVRIDLARYSAWAARGADWGGGYYRGSGGEGPETSLPGAWLAHLGVGPC